MSRDQDRSPSLEVETAFGRKPGDDAMTVYFRKTDKLSGITVIHKQRLDDAEATKAIPTTLRNLERELVLKVLERQGQPTQNEDSVG